VAPAQIGDLFDGTALSRNGEGQKRRGDCSARIAQRDADPFGPEVQGENAPRPGGR
jgi:hypothetical protein